MTEETQWALGLLKEWQRQAKTVPDQALWQALRALVQEQDQRMRQAEAEIDGRAWRPSDW